MGLGLNTQQGGGRRESRIGEAGEMVTATAGQGGKTLVFTPTLNDTTMLAQIAADIRDLPGPFTYLVIDDGSEEAIDREELGEDVLYARLPTNVGVGTCTHVAFDHALSYGYGAVVRVDADGQHPVENIPDLLAPIQSGDADMAVGQRVNRDSLKGMRALTAMFVRNYLAFVARLITRGRAPQDVSSGFFAANPAAARILNSFQLERFSEAQMYILACRNNLKVVELPIVQAPRLQGRSTVTLGQALRLVYRFNVFVLAELLQQSRVR